MERREARERLNLAAEKAWLGLRGEVQLLFLAGLIPVFDGFSFVSICSDEIV